MGIHFASRHFALLAPLVLVVGCMRSSSDVARIRELEQRHTKLEQEHVASINESKRVSSRLGQIERELGDQVAESKKIAAEREELQGELKKTTRDRDDLGKSLAARTEELVTRTRELVATVHDLKMRTRERDDLKIDLTTRTKERDLAYQDLQQFTSEMQGLLARMESSLQMNQKKTTSASSFYPPGVPTPPVAAPNVAAPPVAVPLPPPPK
jgi:septal ring factor EnvC (AmiA/AmiB activator)